MYTDNRNTYRTSFYQAWQKQLKKMPIEPLEAQIIEVISQHPEYHNLLAKDTQSSQEYEPEENPFLHMSLHLSLREQLKLDRPFGIKQIFSQLLEQHQNQHDVEHLMMTCLANILWNAQQTGKMPDEAEYVKRLRELIQQ